MTSLAVAVVALFAALLVGGMLQSFLASRIGRGRLVDLGVNVPGGSGVPVVSLSDAALGEAVRNDGCAEGACMVDGAANGLPDQLDDAALIHAWLDR